LFLDEVDGIAGREDYGGIDALVDIIKKPSIPIILAANSKNVKIKDLAKSCKVIEFKPISPTMLMLYLEQVLRMEKKDLDISQKISIVFNSRGDMRSLLNSAQSRAAGYATVANSDVIDMDIADAINGYFSSDQVEEAAKYLLKADASYSDPRFGMSAEERRKDMINALFSSIVSSRIDPESLAKMLDTISQADVLVGRVAENRQWHLLKYLNPILTYGLFKDSRNKSIKYNQYSIIWPILGPIYARSQANRNLFKEIASEAHTSRSIFGATYFPYLIKVLLNEKIDPKEFILSNNLEEKYGDALLKEMERMKRK
jgi:replication factor C large subunit